MHSLWSFRPLSISLCFNCLIKFVCNVIISYFMCRRRQTKVFVVTDRLVIEPLLLSFSWFWAVSTSVVDPNPHGSAFILVGWIRIRFQKGEMTHKSEENSSVEVFESFEVSKENLLRDKEFSCSLYSYVFYGGLYTKFWHTKINICMLHGRHLLATAATNYLCRWLQLAQLAKGKKSRP